MTGPAVRPKGKSPHAHVPYGEGRSALLDAAVRLAAARGLRHLTYRAVAEEASVSHGLVVHHFGSRDALIEQTAAHMIHAQALEPRGDDSAPLATLLSELAGADPDTRAFRYELMLESRRRPDLRPHMRILYDRYADATGRELNRILPNGAPRALNRLVLAALDGLALHKLVLGEPDTVDEAGVAELRYLLSLLGADSGNMDTSDGERGDTHATGQPPPEGGTGVA
ncbi:TetR family transcriptional regulator [Streptomyces sp. NPDC004658]|uniref:TetR/AcrR family transcriptional regulator n=1 Tax=Streptomyces sp. NPDC004658 TaxID=3154672 RepID=UPI0033A60072